jgi:hypothetical protein
LHGTAFVGTSVQGLFVGDGAEKQLSRQHVPELGTSVTSLSFSAGVLAIGTGPAVFHCQHEPGGSLGKCDHQLVSAVIDDVPTALALTSRNDYLYIGNNLSASAWDLVGGQVKRVAGAQGLPAANITSMLSSGDALWVGHAQGLSFTHLSARRTEPQHGRWRYFNGDRYLPGERVTAIALPAGASPSDAPSVWAATDWGIALIESKAQTLASKAIAMEAKLHPLNRYGWHGPVRMLTQLHQLSCATTTACVSGRGKSLSDYFGLKFCLRSDCYPSRLRRCQQSITGSFGQRRTVDWHVVDGAVLPICRHK